MTSQLRRPSPTQVVQRAVATVVPTAPSSPYVLPPDPANLRPPARANIAAQPLLLAEEVFSAEVDLIRRVASRQGYLYMANWYMDYTLDLQLKPRTDTLMHLLADCAARGGRIRTILWDGSLRQFDPILSKISSPLTSRLIRDVIGSKYLHTDVNRASAGFIKKLRNALVLLDDDTVAAGSHHQKLLVAINNEEIAAVVGGVEWSASRTLGTGGGTPYFDVSVQLDGQAAADVAVIFGDRWAAAGGNPNDLAPLPPARSSGRAGATVQVAPNYGCGHPLKNVKRPVRGASRMIENLFRNCRQFFYAEDQYGMGNADLKDAIGQAFKNGAYGIVVLATAAGVDDNPEVEYWRYRFWSQFRAEIGTQRLFVFERMGDDSNPAISDPNGPHAYVHSKLVLVDDAAVSIGSLNLNRRSWYNDSEFAAVITDAPSLVRDLRLKIWGKHLAWPPGHVDGDIRDPVRAKAIWQAAYAGTHPRPLLRPLTFATRPKRQSEQMPWWFDALRVAGGAVGSYMSGKDIDSLMDAAHNLIYDPVGPSSC